MQYIFFYWCVSSYIIYLYIVWLFNWFIK